MRFRKDISMRTDGILLVASVVQSSDVEVEHPVHFAPQLGFLWVQRVILAVLAHEVPGDGTTVGYVELILSLIISTWNYLFIYLVRRTHFDFIYIELFGT